MSEEVEEAPAVEMTAIPKSKSKEEEQPEKPKTQINEEINTNSSCCREAGGCFLWIFCSSDQSSILMDNAINVLQLFREKTRIINKDDAAPTAGRPQ